MNFNRHSNLEGQHAFLGASKYHWINYSEDKVAEAYSKFLATQKGTVLHDFAARCISLADDCDAAAVHLQAAALPRQKYQVILPLTKIKDNEVYAPNYKDGETVALIRYPHGGTFEIPKMLLIRWALIHWMNLSLLMA